MHQGQHIEQFQVEVLVRIASDMLMGISNWFKIDVK